MLSKQSVVRLIILEPLRYNTGEDAEFSRQDNGNSEMFDALNDFGDDIFRNMIQATKQVTLLRKSKADGQY